MDSHTGEQKREQTRWVALGWFYDHEGRRHGPYTGPEIQRRVAAGEVPPDVPAYVGWKRGDDVSYLQTDLKYALGIDRHPSAQPKPLPTDSSAASVPTVHDQVPDTAKEEDGPKSKG